MTQKNDITSEEHVKYLEDRIEHLVDKEKEGKFFIENVLINLGNGVLRGEIKSNHYLRAVLAGNISVKYKPDLDRGYMIASYGS
jgi:hypothetical protein